MPTLAVISLEKSSITTGQVVNAAVLVTNLAGAAPIAVSRIHLYHGNPQGRPSNAVQINLGSGGGGIGMNPTVPVVVNPDTTRSFPFDVTAFGADRPGSNPMSVEIDAHVVLSDGSIVAADAATITICSLMASTGDTGSIPTSPMMAFQGFDQGSFIFSSNQNSVLFTPFL